MTQFICALYPTAAAAAKGEIPTSITIEAKSEKLAVMKLDMMIEEDFPDMAGRYLKPKIAESIPGGVGRPPVDAFSEEWIKNYEWDRETKNFIAIKHADTSDDLDPLASMKVIFDLPISERISYIAMYGSKPDEIDQEHLSNACDIAIDDDADPEIRAIIDGFQRVPAVKAMLPASVEMMIDALRAQTPPCDSADEAEKFAIKWVNKPSERESSGPARTYESFEVEVALAIMGVNPDQAKAADVKNAKVIRDNRDTAWRAWVNSLRMIPDILNIPRGELFTLLEKGYRDLKLINDTDARRAYLSSVLSGHPSLPHYQQEEVQVENLGGGKFSISGLEKNASNEGEKTEVGINKPTADDKKPEASQTVAVSHGEAVEQAPAQDDFKQRAAALEKGLSEKSAAELENLHIWKKVQSTDPRYTKPLEGVGFAGTSINAEYMFMRATEIFGPVGAGWGYEIVEDRMLNGAPLSESIYENNKFIRSILLRDADGTLLYEKNHVLRIKFWYVVDGDVRGELEAYGSTPYLYKSKRGITTDGETHKKSLTDAIKKALSMLGFSADIWLGWHDMPEYLADNAIEHSIKNASDKAEDTVRLRKELDDKFAQNTETMRTAVTSNEVTKIASSLNRTIGVHLKNAKAVNDTEHARYLETRLRRLDEIKNECLARFEGEKV
jgi:hypothetical protein